MRHLTDQYTTFGKVQRAFLRRLWLGLIVLAPTLAHAQLTGVLEIPSNGVTLSGIGVISGWKCEAEGDITISLNAGESIPATYGLPRADTSGVCDNDGNNGFFSYTNWGTLGDGTHTAAAYDNGVEFGRSTFRVTTLGEEFLRGAQARVTVENFPSPGETAVLEWNQSTQHFEIVEVELLEDPLASYDRAYWRQVERDTDADTYASESFLYASLPDLNACTAGTLTQEAKDRALEGINQIRALHGLADVRYSSLYDTSVQQAALIMAANNYLTHDPDPSDRCYTETVKEAGPNNINFSQRRDPSTGLGLPEDPVVDMLEYTNDSRDLSPDARRESGIIGYASAGHRRWVLNPFATYMSYGQVYGFTVHKVSSFDREPNINPQVEVDYIAFPYETYPSTLMFSNPPWSFSVVENKTYIWGNWHPYFDSATVSVTRVSDGASLTVRDLYTDTDGFGVPNFLSWTVTDWVVNTLYQVEINNVAMQSGGTRNFSYQVYIDRAGLM